MAEASAELSLLSNLDSLLRLSSVQSRPKTTVVRAEAIVSAELSLLSKLGAITALELGCGATTSVNPKGCQEIEGDLHVSVLPDSPHAQIETSAVDDELLVKPAGLVAYSLTW
ncbi:hypothetical protein Acr_05g0008480 [Actinidia rufa]|uniref:Uncharacterized protein n=1 Tax=Actinidia rufa TaxID=165716 RepID=A0A7J0EMJ2_9ERIC|nr:hypothetical protein Acr_05g0008480 [Actinidia rufa]